MTDVIDENNQIPTSPPSAGLPRDAIDYVIDYVIVYGGVALITFGLALGISFCVSRLARRRSTRWKIWATALAAPIPIILGAVVGSIIGHDGTLDGLLGFSAAPWTFVTLIVFMYGVAWLAARHWVLRIVRRRCGQIDEVFQ